MRLRKSRKKKIRSRTSSGRESTVVAPGAAQAESAGTVAVAVAVAVVVVVVVAAAAIGASSAAISPNEGAGAVGDVGVFAVAALPSEDAEAGVSVVPFSIIVVSVVGGEAATMGEFMFITNKCNKR